MSDYNEDSIRSLQWNVHLRERPGMYIGKLGDGSEPDDGIYVLLKEVIDNSIDEFMRGYGRNIEVTIKDSQVSVRDYGRGMPLAKNISISTTTFSRCYHANPPTFSEKAKGYWE